MLANNQLETAQGQQSSSVAQQQQPEPLLQSQDSKQNETRTPLQQPQLPPEQGPPIDRQQSTLSQHELPQQQQKQFLPQQQQQQPPQVSIPGQTLTANTEKQPSHEPLIPLQQQQQQQQLPPHPGQQQQQPQTDAILAAGQQQPIASLLPQQHPISASPSKTQVTKIKLTDELNLFDWSRASEIINQIAEKAKNSVDSVITVLDPGMKEYLYSGGDINIQVISDSGNHIGSIRDAFQSTFGRATVSSVSKDQLESAGHPIKLASGFDQSIIIGKERIKRLRLNASSIPQNQVVVVVQPTLMCVETTIENHNTSAIDGDGSQNGNNEITGSKENLKIPNYFFTYGIVIDDPVLAATLCCFSQMIPIELDVVNQLRLREFDPNFKDIHLGYARSIHESMDEQLKLNQTELTEDDEPVSWIKIVAGLDESRLIHDLSLSLAHSYRKKWNECMAR